MAHLLGQHYFLPLTLSRTGPKCLKKIPYILYTYINITEITRCRNMRDKCLPSVHTYEKTGQFYHTQRNLFGILLNQPEIRLYLQFSG